MRRANQQHAYVLHQYPYSESSVIVELITRERGRVLVLAKGAKKPTSNFRTLLLPFQALRVDYAYAGSDNEDVIGTIRGVERAGGPASPKGDALLAGMYLNELLMRLLPRLEPQAAVFQAYEATLHVLAQQPEKILEVLLRSFELVLLKNVGMLPDLTVQTISQEPLEEGRKYSLIPETGLHPTPAGARGLVAKDWLLLQDALNSTSGLTQAMKVLHQAEAAADLKSQLRVAFAHYLHGDLHTQRLMRNLRRL